MSIIDAGGTCKAIGDAVKILSQFFCDCKFFA